ncbi:polysaccharide deacetylase, partial [Bacillus thuringiensis]|nr:polysaccharide deacetylase [Bacillus thuringiensis]
MKESQNKKKTNVGTKAILSLGVVLATTFFTFFLIGKWNSIPAKGVANESSNQVNTQQQEKKKETPP